LASAKGANGRSNLFSAISCFVLWATAFDLLFVCRPASLGNVQATVTSFYTRTPRWFAGIYLQAGFGANELRETCVAGRKCAAGASLLTMPFGW
jgi:hypothetical protein